MPSLQNYKPKLPDAYPGQILKEGDGETLKNIPWESFYQDPTLQKLIELGLAYNHDVKESLLRICESRALFGIERSALLPDVEESFSYTRQKTNSSRRNFSGNNSGSSNNSGPSLFSVYDFDAGITGYELDFFGRVRSLKDAALHSYLGTVSASRSIRMTLIADIATTYISLRANQALLALAERSKKIREEAYDLVVKRAKEGIATDLELAEAETILLQASVDKYLYLDAVARDKNALRFLVGTHTSLPDLEARPGQEYFHRIVVSVPLGLPSSLLCDRPDLIEAEHQLFSAHADIGAARAAFFPQISLTTTGGYSSNQFSNLFDKSNQIWTFMPSITLPIFTGGRLRHSLNLAEVRKEIAIVNYERKIESAFREVADALATVTNFDKRVSVQKKLAEASKKRWRLSLARYDAGIENYLSVLDSTRELYTSERELIQQKAQLVNAKIVLYKAVGGGYQNCAAPVKKVREKK